AVRSARRSPCTRTSSVGKRRRKLPQRAARRSNSREREPEEHLRGVGSSQACALHAGAARGLPRRPPHHRARSEPRGAQRARAPAPEHDVRHVRHVLGRTPFPPPHLPPPPHPLPHRLPPP